MIVFVVVGSRQGVGEGVSVSGPRRRSEWCWAAPGCRGSRWVVEGWGSESGGEVAKLKAEQETKVWMCGRVEVGGMEVSGGW